LVQERSHSLYGYRELADIIALLQRVRIISAKFAGGSLMLKESLVLFALTFHEYGTILATDVPSEVRVVFLDGFRL
jgi:hypothetical protein